jgi:hypothetical protein
MCAGEPIVLTPEDAFRCFMETELDGLAIGNLYLDKGEQGPALKLDYKRAFERRGALCNTSATAKCRRDLSLALVPTRSLA